MMGNNVMEERKTPMTNDGLLSLRGYRNQNLRVNVSKQE